VVEEIFYRGLVLRAAARRFGTRWAVFGSSAIFGVSQFELVQFPGLFAFGVVLALLAVRTGRLGASIAAHVAFNGVAVIGLAVAR
ncbi:MAG: CPBP family intramembrane metalloprotease, partial [Acidimicrobiales bacterium]|nr:CPBP family intramembrane metalloprotease [Acidimicrobiales bacterium]